MEGDAEFRFSGGQDFDAHTRASMNRRPSDASDAADVTTREEGGRHLADDLELSPAHSDVPRTPGQYRKGRIF